MPANTVKNNGTINVWIHAHTHNDPGWLVNTDQYYVKVGNCRNTDLRVSKCATSWRLQSLLLP